MLRDHGQIKKYLHDVEGYNGRLDAIQAAILRIKLRHLSDWNEKRQQNAHQYNELFGQSDGVIPPYGPSWTRAVYHLYVIRTSERDKLQEFLSQQAIGTGLHYPLPLHLQEAYCNLAYNKGHFPIAERVSSEIVSLPMYPGLTYDQQNTVAQKVKEFIKNK